MDRHGTQSGKLTGINKGDALLGGAVRLWPLRLMSLLADEHEPATHSSTCNRHSNDAAVPAPYLTRLGAQTYATTYAYPFENRPLPRLCENAKLAGFRVSLYASRTAAKPIQRDLKGRIPGATRPPAFSHSLDPTPSSDASCETMAPLRLHRRHSAYYVQLKRELIRSFDNCENIRFVFLLLIISECRPAVLQIFKV